MIRMSKLSLELTNHSKLLASRISSYINKRKIMKTEGWLLKRLRIKKFILARSGNLCKRSLLIRNRVMGLHFREITKRFWQRNMAP